MTVNHQIGLVDETTYGQAVTVDTFYEYLPGDPIALATGRTESNSLRAGQSVMRADRFLPYVTGADGTRSLEVLSLGFEWWLTHLLGGVAVQADTPVTGADTHTATIDDMFGTSFTYQENVPLGPSQATDQALTFAGGKVASWSLACETEGNLVLEVTLAFSGYTTGTALATASYPAGAELLSWARSLVEVDDTQLDVTSWKVSVDNMLKLDRHYLAGTGAAPSTGRREPVTNGHRAITVEFACDRTDLTLWNKFAAEARASTLIKFEALTQGPAVITGSTYPALNLTCPAARLDEASLGQLGLEMPSQTLTAKVLDDGTNEPITVDYITVGA